MRKTIFAFLTGLMMFGTITAASASPDSKNQTAKKPKVQTGIDTLLPDYKKQLKGKRIGLITNPAGVNTSLKSSVDILYENPDIKLTALFGPEHGVRGDAQAGDEVGSYIEIGRAHV